MPKKIAEKETIKKSKLIIRFKGKENTLSLKMKQVKLDLKF